MPRLLLAVLLAVAFLGAGAVVAPARAVPTGDARAAGAPAHYRFPIRGCRTSYARTHHDYPAADIFAAGRCRFVAPVSVLQGNSSRGAALLQTKESAVEEAVPSSANGNPRGTTPAETTPEMLPVETTPVGVTLLMVVSVIVPVISFKLTGKRVFMMAPLHHHYEKKGWQEPTIVIRFWIVAMLLGLAGLSTLKLR